MSGAIRKLISTANAPRPVAPYNQAVLVDYTLYVSGVLGLNKDNMKLVEGGVVPETKLALKNLGCILEAGGSSFDRVVKTTILLKNIEDFTVVNQIYQEFFTRDFPARCAYQVAALPLGAQIEIDAIAISGQLHTLSITTGQQGCATCGPDNCRCKM